MEQQAPYRAVPNTASSEETRPLRVLLATVGNSDRGQNPVAPLPGLKPYYVSVNSLLEARQKCLEYINKTGIGGVTGPGGGLGRQQETDCPRVL